MEIACPHCNQNYAVPASMAGNVVECEACTGKFSVPIPTAKVAERPAMKNIDNSKEEDIFILKPSFKSSVFSIVIAILMVIAGLAGIVSHIAFLILSACGILFFLYVWYGIAATTYRLTSERLFIQTGVISRSIDEIELFRIKDVKTTQGIFQRLMNVGNIVVISTDNTTSNILISGIANPLEVKETLRNVYRNSRKKENVKAMEFIPS